MRTDWRIVSSLRRDPWRNVGDVARDVGVSTRTVRRRLTAMIEGGAFNLLPLGDVKRSAGLTYQFFLRLESSKKRKVDEAARAKLSSLVFANVWSGPYSGYSVFCRNIAEAEATRDWFSAQDGVTGVEMHLMREIIHVRSWLDEEIERRI